MTSGIYSILNSANLKRYIGSSKNVDKRWKGHLGDFIRGTHSKKINNAVKKHGADSFVLEMIEEIDLSVYSVDYMLEREQFWIDHFGAITDGYNSSPVLGRPVTNPCKHRRRPHTAETRSKISKALVGRRKPPRSAERMRRTVETKRARGIFPTRAIDLLIMVKNECDAYA